MVCRIVTTCCRHYFGEQGAQLTVCRSTSRGMVVTDGTGIEEDEIVTVDMHIQERHLPANAVMLSYCRHVGGTAFPPPIMPSSNDTRVIHFLASGTNSRNPGRNSYLTGTLGLIGNFGSRCSVHFESKFCPN